ncbi:MAG TPA: response regulator transcription factor [Candidatus Paceibacterota bacterium]
MRILVVDDDKDIRGYLKANLEAECFAVDTAGDGEEASYLGRNKTYDAIVLDNHMPRKSGMCVCADLRNQGNTTPILMLSVDSDSERKADLLDTGADDYITKPFLYKELRSRLRALLRRPSKTVSSVLQIDDLVLDSSNQTAVRGKKKIYLTRKEFSLLEYLVRNAGMTLSRGSLLEHVWDDEVNIFSNTVETHILNIRKKINAPKKKKLIYTLSGRGYQVSESKPI